MNKFLQLHLITSYAPSNLNRDDLGQPKTAVMGGVNRLRVSSQSLKRAWRTSSLFSETFPKRCGIRSKFHARKVYELLKKDNIGSDNDILKIVSELFGISKADLTKISELKGSTLEYYADGDYEDIIKKLKNQKDKKLPETLWNLISKKPKAVDIAMFGRMFASSPSHNVEAAVQVAHAISVHAVSVESDYFTAIDDLNKPGAEFAFIQDAGASHLGETAFASAVFYIYVCIDMDLLKENLSTNDLSKEEVDDLLKEAVRVLTKVSATVSPSGKQNSFASRSYASYVMAEKGDEQPRSLAAAFLKPISNEQSSKDYAKEAIIKMVSYKNALDIAYDSNFETFHFDIEGTIKSDDIKNDKKGNMKELLDFVSQ